MVDKEPIEYAMQQVLNKCAEPHCLISKQNKLNLNRRILPEDNVFSAQYLQV